MLNPMRTASQPLSGKWIVVRWQKHESCQAFCAEDCMEDFYAVRRVGAAHHRVAAYAPMKRGLKAPDYWPRLHSGTLQSMPR